MARRSYDDLLDVFHEVALVSADAFREMASRAVHSPDSDRQLWALTWATGIGLRHLQATQRDISGRYFTEALPHARTVWEVACDLALLIDNRHDSVAVAQLYLNMIDWGRFVKPLIFAGKEDTDANRRQIAARPLTFYDPRNSCLA